MFLKAIWSKISSIGPLIITGAKFVIAKITNMSPLNIAKIAITLAILILSLIAGYKSHVKNDSTGDYYYDNASPIQKNMYKKPNRENLKKNVLKKKFKNAKYYRENAKQFKRYNLKQVIDHINDAYDVPKEKQFIYDDIDYFAARNNIFFKVDSPTSFKVGKKIMVDGKSYEADFHCPPMTMFSYFSGFINYRNFEEIENSIPLKKLILSDFDDVSLADPDNCDEDDLMYRHSQGILDIDLENYDLSKQFPNLSKNHLYHTNKSILGRNAEGSRNANKYIDPDSLIFTNRTRKKDKSQFGKVITISEFVEIANDLEMDLDPFYDEDINISYIVENNGRYMIAYDHHRRICDEYGGNSMIKLTSPEKGTKYYLLVEKFIENYYKKKA